MSNWKHSEVLPLYAVEHFIYFPENDALNYIKLILFGESQEELIVLFIKGC